MQISYIKTKKNLNVLISNLNWGGGVTFLGTKSLFIIYFPIFLNDVY